MEQKIYRMENYINHKIIKRRNKIADPQEAINLAINLFGLSRLTNDDILHYSDLLEAIRILSIQKCIIVGTGLPYLHILLTIAGIEVVFIDMSKNVIDIAEHYNSRLTKYLQLNNTSAFTCIHSGFEELDPNKYQLKPHCFDLVTMIDLVGGVTGPIGGTSSWLRQCQELLRPRGYIIADRLERKGDTFSNNLYKIFPQAEVLPIQPYFRGSHEGSFDNNKILQI